MMDYEKISNESKDIIYEKMNRTIEKSQNILHKKAIALIKGLKEQIGNEKSSGLEGIKAYTKSVMDLVQLLLIKLISSKNYTNEIQYDDDLKNCEALIFTLAVCIKQLPFPLLRSTKLTNRILDILEKAIAVIKHQEIKKYFIIILEKLLLSRNEAELQNENDEVVKFYIEYLFMFLEDSHLNDEVQKTLAKSMSKILKVPNMINLLKYSLLIQIKNFLIAKIRGMCYGKDYEGNMINNNSKNYPIGYPNNQNNHKSPHSSTNTKAITTNEGEIILKFLCSIMQFFPFDMVNDLICELTEVVAVSEKEHILLNSLLCFEVAFNTKSFALETSEKIMAILLGKENLINTESKIDVDSYSLGDNKKRQGVNINTSLTVSYIKSTTQVLLNIAKVNVLVAVKYFNSVVSLFGEFLSSQDEFLKSSVFNCLQNMLNNLLNHKNMEIISRSILGTRNNTNIIHDEMNDFNPDALSLEINLSNNKKDVTVLSILENITQCLLYMVSDRFDDLKPGFNLLYNFIERINKENIKEIIHPMIENVLLKLSEAEKLHKNQTFKVFIGKLFNLINSTQILKFFPVQILDYEICSDEYTENSKVWIISYIDKFLRQDTKSDHNSKVNTLKEFFESFYMNILDIEKVILKLKSSKCLNNNNKNSILDSNEMEMEQNNEEDEDEKFQINENESEHVRMIKIKRYELILQQIWNLSLKFLNWNENFHEYTKELLKKFEEILNLYNTNNHIMICNIREIVFRCVAKLVQTSISQNDMKSIEVIKKEGGKNLFSKCLNLIILQKLNTPEQREGFNLISAFCKITTEKFLFKIICDMIEKFDKTFQKNFQVMNDNLSNSSNKAKLNESLNVTNDGKKKDNKDQKQKDIKTLCFRIEIINYILKNIKGIQLGDTNPGLQESDSLARGDLFVLLNSFFEKFFFNESVSKIHILNKKLIDLFMKILEKISDPEKVLEIFTRFTNEYRGLDNLTPKQKAKLFEFIIDIVIKRIQDKNLNLQNLNIAESISKLHILVEIVSLTKDTNRKVRNLAYEMIGKITEFMKDSNMFDEWIKMILAILASTSSYLKSGAINSLARVFWQLRNSNGSRAFNTNELKKLVLDTADIVIILTRESNKEITRSIFLFYRVLVYLIKNIFSLSVSVAVSVDSSSTIHKILHSIFVDSNEEIRKEFKVKIRNLLKNLIINFSFDEVKKIIPKDFEALLNYVNKYIVKKIKNMTKEEESVYGANLDHSVMMDNEENLVDEEEEYIEKEFKKIEKRRNDEEKIFENLEKFKLEEDDPEAIRRQNEKESKPEDKLDKIDQLFKKDNVSSLIYIHLYKLFFLYSYI